jgi:mRNA-degrading endonuclease HigB of HigAB toxin-antitoxin module
MFEVCNIYMMSMVAAFTYRERDDTPFTKPACLFALFSLLNLSRHKHNQAVIAMKGYRNIMNINFCFKAIFDEFPTPVVRPPFHTPFECMLIEI